MHTGGHTKLRSDMLVWGCMCASGADNTATTAARIGRRARDLDLPGLPARKQERAQKSGVEMERSPFVPREQHQGFSIVSSKPLPWLQAQKQKHAQPRASLTPTADTAPQVREVYALLKFGVVSCCRFSV